METLLAIAGKASAGSAPASDRAGKSRIALVIQLLGSCHVGTGYMIGWERSLLAAGQHCGMEDHFKGRRADISPAIKKISGFAF